MFPSRTETNSHSRITKRSKIKAEELKTRKKTNPAKNNKKINSSNNMKLKQTTTTNKFIKNKMRFCPTQKISNPNINKKTQKQKQALSKSMEPSKHKSHASKTYNLKNKTHKKYTSNLQ